MIKLDKRELQALHILKTNPDFKIFLDILNKSATLHATQSCVSKDDITSKWLQGRYQEDMDILTTIRNADDDLRQMNAKPSLQ